VPVERRSLRTHRSRTRCGTDVAAEEPTAQGTGTDADDDDANDTG